MSKLFDVKKKLAKDYSDKIFIASGYKRLPSGIFALDYTTGGGIPDNRIILKWGPKASSKTTTALRYAGQLLDREPNQNVVFIDFEQTYDELWFSNFIKDMKRFHPITPTFGEEGINIIKSVGLAEDVGMIIVDSIATMVPIGEYEKDATEGNYATLPRLVNSMFRKLFPVLAQARKSGRSLYVIFINQPTVDTQMKKGFGNPKKPVGGERQGLLASMEFIFYKGSYTKKGQIPYKVKHLVTLEKNKVGLAKRTCEYSFYITDYEGHKAGEVDEVDMIVEYAKRLNIIERRGNKWGIGKNEFDTLREINILLTSDPKNLATMKQRTLEAALEKKNLFIGQEQEEVGTSDD